ncbi:hypothetical protein [Streptomyces sp. AC555_RSS877]|uniref:hypothetical protein n=1 Tax=Streptomyces sp. AC555_RSS877 TaxID=2823688 RepID=UPI001C27E95F|nr:hypothetical protein [Streptomyces sp. AC555_RSS877]
MGGRELESRILAVGPVDKQELRKAAIHIADRVAGHYPELTAGELAKDPGITVGLLELLDAIGYRKEQP